MSGTGKSEEVSKEDTSPRARSSSSGSAKRKRKSEIATVTHQDRHMKRRKMSSRSRSPRPGGSSRHDRSKKKERDYKLDEIFHWVRQSQIQGDRRSRERSRYSSRSSRSGRSYRSRSTSYDRDRRSFRKEHEMSVDSRSERNLEEKKSKEVEGDILTRRLQALREESEPKPVTGPPLSDDLALVVDMCVRKSEFLKMMKTCEKYPKPSNLVNLSIPELPKDSNQTIEQKVVKNDEKLQNDQKLTSAMISVMGRALDVILKLKEKVPELIPVGDMLFDGVQIAGFFTSRFH